MIKGKISVSANVLFGKPTIQGTRISVEQVLACLSESWTHAKMEVLDIRNRINDTVYIKGNSAGSGSGDGKRSIVKAATTESGVPAKISKKPPLLRRIVNSIPGLRKAA